jgi:hypothetical protein
MVPDTLSSFQTGRDYLEVTGQATRVAGKRRVAGKGGGASPIAAPSRLTENGINPQVIE